ncbi:hypothetical protein SY85_24860 [Flavisolibacter tropicus]|uniref:Membrane metalloprotease n=2 Tax=Flavisolibacter tropicus TaxID=1492898 RepID=A0A172U3H6_9BACT|nr:hypothetical protein SY85_24860 [Flavisolibacter tropicus]
MSCTKSIAAEDQNVIEKNYHLQRVGSSARDFLTDENFTSLRIEVQYMPGYEPDAKALLNLKYFLYDHLHKPGGISIVTKEIPSSADSSLTMQEVIGIEKANRTAFTKNKELTVYILYTNGYYIEGQMLGYAYLNTSAVLFGRNLDDNSNKFKKLNRSDLETRVLQHEVCHLLGLVNVGSALQSAHKDDDHGKHCINKQCLMYFLTDTEESPSFLLRKTNPKLDAACLEDLKANGGK